MATEQIGERAFHAGIALHELSPHTGSLEELFLDWTTRQQTPTRLDTRHKEMATR
jgi:hypothetical protein